MSYLISCKVLNRTFCSTFVNESPRLLWPTEGKNCDLHVVIPGSLNLHAVIPGSLNLHVVIPGSLNLHVVIPGSLNLHVVIPGSLNLHASAVCVSY